MRSQLAILLLGQICQAALRTYHFTITNGTRAPDGYSRQVYLINDQSPGPLIEVDEGDELEVLVKNELGVEMAVHWHGILQRGTPQMDGAPGVTQEPIEPGGNFTYRMTFQDEYGFSWYHSHFRAYADDAVRGPIMIHPSPKRSKPYKHLACDDSVLAAMQEAEREAVPLLLSDWYHRVSDDVFREYFTTGAYPNCVDSLLVNGQGRVQCLPEDILAAGPNLGMDQGHGMTQGMEMSTMSTATQKSMAMETMSTELQDSMAMETMSMNHKQRRMMDDMAMDDMPMATATTSASSSLSDMGGMSMATTATSSMAMSSSSMSGTGGMSGMMDMSLGPRGCFPPMMFNPGYNASSLPPETCTNTTSPLLSINANYTRGWLALNLVNGGSTTKLGVSLDSHTMMVYAADGYYVEPQEVQVLHISNGQRYSVMVKLDQEPGHYTLRFASYPYGSDMPQLIQGQAIITYQCGMDMDMSMDTPGELSTPWMLLNGSAASNATHLDEKSLVPAEANPPPAHANLTYNFSINQTDVTAWVMNGTPYQEPQVPILRGNTSEGWNASTTLHVPLNSVIDLILQIAPDSMDAMGHPIHLHGNRFWLLGSGSDTSFSFQNVADAAASSPSLLNLENPPYRDTTDLPEKGWVVLRFVADNPGAWMFHCHMQWHLASGLAVVFVVGEQEVQQLLGQC